MQCVHDTLATDNTGLGLQTLQDQQKFQNLALTLGERAPLDTQHHNPNQCISDLYSVVTTV